MFCANHTYGQLDGNYNRVRIKQEVRLRFTLRTLLISVNRLLLIIMIAFGHTAIGVGVGLAGYSMFGQGPLAQGLILTGAIGVASHYLADFIPHGHLHKHKDFKSKIVKIIIFDLFLSILIFTSLGLLKFGLSPKFWYLMFGIGGSQLPDVVDGFIYIGVLKARGLLKLEYDFHGLTHWHGDRENALMWGWRDVWQVATILAALFLLWQV